MASLHAWRLICGLSAASAAQVAYAQSTSSVIKKYQFDGEILIAQGDHILLHQAYGTLAPGRTARHVRGESWRLASITKQITATEAMQAVERGVLKLDESLAASLGPSLAGITLKMLLQHHSGLANPDDTPAAIGQMPNFYRATAPDLAYCTSKLGTAQAPFAYNNCDYLLIGKLLDPLRDGSKLRSSFRSRNPVPGFVRGRAEPSFNLATFGAAGDLVGTAADLFRYDRALMTGKLLSKEDRALLWQPEGNGSYQALGQWVFPGKLQGCATAKRIVQRDGEIQGVQTRNFILPDDDLLIIVFTNRSSDDFTIGEVWQQSGFAYELLSAAACRVATAKSRSVAMIGRTRR